MPTQQKNNTLTQHYNDEPFSWQLIRSKKRVRSVSFQVQKGQLIVRSPFRYPLAKIKRWIHENTQWIKARCQQGDRVLKEGDVLTILDQKLTVRWLDSPQKKERARIHAYQEEDKLFLCQSSAKGISKKNESNNEPNNESDASFAQRCVQANLRSFLLQKAQETIPSRVTLLCQTSNNLLPIPNKISFAFQRNRWGSLSTRLIHKQKFHHLRLNARLLLAESYLLDSVLYHELCHQLEANHGPRFWSLYSQCGQDRKKVSQQLQALSLDWV